MVGIELEQARAALLEDGHTPLPRVLPGPWLSGLWLSGAYFSWVDCPVNVKAALLAGTPTYVLTPGHQLLLLRDAKVKMRNGPGDKVQAIAGRTVEVSVEDYVLWSLDHGPKAVAPSARAPVQTEMDGGVCTECAFSVEKCSIHNI